MPGEPGSGPVFLQELSCSDSDTHILNCNRYVSSHFAIQIQCAYRPLFRSFIEILSGSDL